MRHASSIRFLALVTAAALSACGGGGGGGAGADGAADGLGAAALDAGPLAVANAAGGAAGSGNAAAPQEVTWSKAPGVVADTWHWVARNPDGSVVLAASAPGGVVLSRDGGSSWTAAAGLPPSSLMTSAAMSDDGRVIVAVALNGGMYRSLDSGRTWHRIDASFNASEFLDWQSVSVSGDGTRIVAAILGGGLWVSSNGTADAPTFMPATTAQGQVLASWWRAVATDGSGMRVVAASHNGDVWASQDGGATFEPLVVTVAGTPVEDGWYRLSLSRDGNTLALAGNEEYGVGRPAGSRSTGLYVGRWSAQQGWTFARASAAAGHYTGIAIAADAPVIAATRSGANGGVLVSSDNGNTFTAVNTPKDDTLWRSIALAGDGRRAVLVAGTFQDARGSLYTTSDLLAP